MTPAEQRQLITDAITALQAGAHIPDVPDEWQDPCRRGLVEAMRFALTDHDTDGCPHADGECYATSRARSILAAQQEGAAA